jgi:hypothetical protein
MEEKKIATSVDILINVGAYEHIQITKYAEKKITYENPEEMTKKEDQLTDELVKDIIRTMRSMPDKLGKKTSAVPAIEEKIGKRMPTWLEEGSDPNIANAAKDSAIKNTSDAYAKNEDIGKKSNANAAETDAFLDGKPGAKEQVSSEKVEKPKEKVAKIEEKDLDGDLFGDNEDLFK